MIAREKDLPKLHKAAWRGDLAKVKQVSKHMKRGGPDVNYQDKEQRCVSVCLSVCMYVCTPTCIPTGVCIHACKFWFMHIHTHTCTHAHTHTCTHPQTCRTALHLACARGHSDIVNYLLSMKVSVTACDSDGCTPLHKVIPHAW